MDDRQINKALGWAICIIIAYHIAGYFIPLLESAVVIIIVWRVVALFLRRH